MRISAIQSYGVKPMSKKSKISNPIQTVPQSTQSADTVSFRGKNAIKGAGIGALIGIGALAVISGGLAAPIAYGVYAATTGTACGMLGHAVDKINEEEKNDKTNE